MSGGGQHVRNASAVIEEELAQIRRYEDFSTTGKKREFIFSVLHNIT
jgi:hypothetical protein